MTVTTAVGNSGATRTTGTGKPTAWTSGRPLPGSVYAAMDRAAHSLTSASRAQTPGERFVAAHVAALQVVAAVLAARPRPTGRGRTMNAWLLLERSAPDLADWATYFSAGAAKRAGVEAGLDHIVSPTEADALQSASEQFFHEIADRLGLTPAVLLGAVGYDAA
jgi:hypothetical protein